MMHPMRQFAQPLGAIVGASTLALVSACTLVDPVVKVDIATVEATSYQKPTELPKAVAYAEAVRAAYRKRVGDQMEFQNSVGLGLIAGGAAAAGLGIEGVAREIILALGLAGATAYTSSQLLTSRLQQHIYEAGADAIGCSIGAMAPRRANYAYLKELKDLVEGAAETAAGSLRQELDKIEPLVTRLGKIPGARKVQGFVNAEAALAVGKAAEVRGRDAISEMEEAGGVLLAAVRRIEGKVTRAIIDARPDLSDFKASLAEGLPTAAAQITGRPELFAPKAVGGEAAFEDGVDQTALEDLAPSVDAVVAKSRRINVIADRIGDQPSAEALQDCNFEVRGAGLTFALAPSGEVTIDVSQDRQMLTINASGGVPPYSAGWLGRTPTQGIVLDVPDAGRGIVTVTAEKGASAGKFDLLVTDAANGSETIAITVISTPEARASTSAATTPATSIDPTVKEIQKSLIEAGITQVEVEGAQKNLVEDGIWGEITAAAIKKLLAEAGVAEADIPQDKEGLVAEAKTRLGLE